MARNIYVPILAFVVVSALASPLLAQAQDRLGLDPDLLRLTVFSTTVGAAIVWLIWRKGLPFPPTTKRGTGRALLASVALSLLIAGVLYYLARQQGAPRRPAGAASIGASIPIFLLIQFVGAAAEEVGWRGLVQPLLETRLPAYVAALMTGILFAVGHFYMAFEVSPLACLMFVIAAVAMSAIFAALTVGRSPGARILIASVMHFLVNMVTFLLFTDGDGSLSYFTNLAMVFGGFGLMALVVLGRQPSGRASAQRAKTSRPA